ncbi:hypothetical protein [Limibacterium fermenti]|uniref:hypothetical protein n=1 Tax=Limibacterium fermenti TaxID=3229863 RepID=UPI003A648391
MERIKEYIDYKGINIKKFEENVGFSNGSFGSQLKNKRTIGVDKLENILSVYPEISPEWLLTGKGEMLKSKPQPEINPENVVDRLLNELKNLVAENTALKIENENLRNKNAELFKDFGKR